MVVRWRALAAAGSAVLACAVVLAGCGGSSAAGRAAALQQRSVDTIKAQVRALPQVTTVETVYGAEPVGSLVVSAIVRSGSEAALRGVANNIERIVWQSHLTPLRSMRVVVQDTAYRREVVAYVLERDPTWRRLQATYGNRPVGGP